MKTCPKTEAEENSGTGCPEAGGPLEAPSPGAAIDFDFCSRCPACFSGIAMEAGRSYRIEIVGEPDGWSDGDWSASTVDEALKGWHDVSDLPRKPMDWVWRWALGLGIDHEARTKRRVRDADWFRIFLAVRTDDGSESDPIALETSPQTFQALAAGELYLFVNDSPKRYGNNQGRMRLRLSPA